MMQVLFVLVVTNLFTYVFFDDARRARVYAGVVDVMRWVSDVMSPRKEIVVMKTRRCKFPSGYGASSDAWPQATFSTNTTKVSDIAEADASPIWH